MSPPQKSKNWRNRPITKGQREQLERYGLPFREDMLQGEASDLIGTKRHPSAEELEVLRFFKIQGIGSFSQTAARRKIEEIYSNPANVKNWEARPAEKEQRDIYQFFKITIPRGLTWSQANATINELFANEKNEEAWEAHQDRLADLENAAFEREEWFEETLESVNEGASIYQYKKINKKLFGQVVKNLEARGMTLEEIADKEELIIETAAQLDPTRVNPRKTAINTSTHKQTTPLYHSPPNKPGAQWILLILIIIVLLIAAFLKL